MLPQLTPATDLGRLYTDAYSGSSVALSGLSLTVDLAATNIVRLATEDGAVASAYVLTAAGLQPVE